MKSKAAKFKNPFDMMQQQQQAIMDSRPQPAKNNYVPKGKVHAPLPFDPYQNSTSAQSSTIKQVKTNQPGTNYSSIIKQTKKNAVKNKAGFTNPFGSQFQQQPEEQIYNPVKPQTVIGFNPLNTPQYKNSLPQNTEYTGQINQDGDPPLLEGNFFVIEDIGIDISLIKQRLLMTIKAQKPEYQQLQNTDLSGPILIALLFGCLLLLSGKVHFGDIYAMFLFGNTIMYFLLNFMNQAEVVPLYNVMSSLGYALLPMLLLGFFGVFVSLKGTVGILLSLSIAFWASLAAGNTLEVYLKQPHNNRKYLVVYPLFLFYLCFGMIVIF